MPKARKVTDNIQGRKRVVDVDYRERDFVAWLRVDIASGDILLKRNPRPHSKREQV